MGFIHVSHIRMPQFLLRCVNCTIKSAQFLHKIYFGETHAYRLRTLVGFIFIFFVFFLPLMAYESVLLLHIALLSLIYFIYELHQVLQKVVSCINVTLYYKLKINN
jgi:hypothetical protein